MSNRIAVFAILKHWQQAIGVLRTSEAIDNNPNVFLVTTERGDEFVLKRVGGNERLAYVESHTRVLQYLHAAHVPVAVPLLTDSQQFYVQCVGMILLAALLCATMPTS